MKSSSEFELFESRHVVLLDFAFNEPVDILISRDVQIPVVSPRKEE